MRDQDLAVWIQEVARLELAVRKYWEASRDDPPESDAALVAFRLAVPLRRSLETWIQDRAIRAAMTDTVEMETHHGRR